MRHQAPPPPFFFFCTQCQPSRSSYHYFISFLPIHSATAHPTISKPSSSDTKSTPKPSNHQHRAACHDVPPTSPPALSTAGARQSRRSSPSPLPNRPQNRQNQRGDHHLPPRNEAAAVVQCATRPFPKVLSCAVSASFGGLFRWIFSCPKEKVGVGGGAAVSIEGEGVVSTLRPRSILRAGGGSI